VVLAVAVPPRLSPLPCLSRVSLPRRAGTQKYRMSPRRENVWHQQRARQRLPPSGHAAFCSLRGSAWARTSVLLHRRPPGHTGPTLDEGLSSKQRGKLVREIAAPTHTESVG
jgi:hypothetical protein